MSRKPHISVCVCTYKRPDLLLRLLSKLEEQKSEGLFTHSVVVVDNDRSESARHVTESFGRGSTISVQYYVEPEQNISMARNKTVEHAIGDFIAFIDDDESPIDEWLLRMYAAFMNYHVDGVLGPVKPLFSRTPPAWTVKAGFFERPGSCKTGLIIDWKQTGTGNVLIHRSILDDIAGPFDPEFGSGGEDQDFFRRAMNVGKVFVWCEEATVCEILPVERTRLSFQLRRALLRGKASLANPVGMTSGVLKSFAACGCYTISLPVFLLLSRPLFAKHLIKTFDHIGKLLAVCGINTTKQKYILH